jgi:hypothetical protein
VVDVVHMGPVVVADVAQRESAAVVRPIAHMDPDTAGCLELLRPSPPCSPAEAPEVSRAPVPTISIAHIHPLAAVVDTALTRAPLEEGTMVE